MGGICRARGFLISRSNNRVRQIQENNGLVNIVIRPSVIFAISKPNFNRVRSKGRWTTNRIGCRDRGGSWRRVFRNRVSSGGTKRNSATFRPRESNASEVLSEGKWFEAPQGVRNETRFLLLAPRSWKRSDLFDRIRRGLAFEFATNFSLFILFIPEPRVSF